MGSSVDVNAFRQLLGRNIPPLPVLNLKTGEHTTLDTYTERHRVIVLCFWSTWCCGCPDSLDVLDKLASKYLGTVDFYAVNINASEIPKTEVEKWTHLGHLYVNEENKNKFVRGEFGMKFLPHCTIADQKGVVVQNGGNFYVDRASVENQLTKLLSVSTVP